MKFTKFCLLLFMMILSTGLISVKNDNTPLSKEELEYIFPDDNFRKVIYNYFQNEEITKTKLNNLKGEFYASSENIKDLTGISNLKNIDTFVFWNNNISSLPPEIENLNKVKSINVANNYLTTDNIINNLINKGVDVNCDLNFINNKKHQYQLSSKITNLKLKKNQEINLRKYLYKHIDNYPKYWEVTDVLSPQCQFYIESTSPTNISVDSDKVSCKAGNKSGVYYILISLTKDKSPKSFIIIKTTVK